MGKNLMLLVLILLLLLALLVLFKLIHTQVVRQRAALLSHTLYPAGEPLSQPNHRRGFGFGSYFWDVTANYSQQVRAGVHAHRT
jgi:dolichol kinase